LANQPTEGRPGLPTFIVERYVQARELDALIRRERAALQGGDSDGIRHLRSTYVRDDELCLSFFEGPSLDAVRRVNEQAGLPFDRISEAVDVTANEPVVIAAPPRGRKR
jgi:Protein of unknown function (DUF4242)